MRIGSIVIRCYEFDKMDGIHDRKTPALDHGELAEDLQEGLALQDLGRGASHDNSTVTRRDREGRTAHCATHLHAGRPVPES
jgi:hypothetical protein